MNRWMPNAPGWQVAEMHPYPGLSRQPAAEHYCNGLIFSTIVDGKETYGSPITTEAAFQRA